METVTIDDIIKVEPKQEEIEIFDEEVLIKHEVSIKAKAEDYAIASEIMKECMEDESHMLNMFPELQADLDTSSCDTQNSFVKGEADSGNSLWCFQLGYVTAEKFECYHCNYVTYNKVNFIRHVSTHLQAHRTLQKFKCNQCAYETHLESYLKKHSVRHNTTVDYHCPSCPYITNVKRYLKKHMQRHLGLQYFKCDYCEYATKEKSNLTKHLKVHSSNKIYTCSTCGYATNHKSTFRRHLSKHGGYLQCTRCTYTTYSMSLLERHWQYYRHKSKPHPTSKAH